MTPSERLGRRRYLAAAGAAAIPFAAGCTALDSDGGSDGGYDRVVLDAPDEYERLRDARDRGELEQPIHGDELPDVAAPCTIRDEEIATGEFEGERHSLYTFIFSRCHGACPALTSSLRHVQDDSVEGDYVDDVALVNVTFDPEYDTADVLEEYDRTYGVDHGLGNWYSLRPETETDARTYVEEEFGCFFVRNEDFEEHGDEHDDDHDGDEDAHDGDGDEPAEPDELDGEDNGMEMAFQHESMIVFANADGYVERTYVGDDLPSYDELIDDVRTVLESW
ncbi:SCO family protein [Natronococcus sp.]|uniref:SCO family protein n=1 Tax=Natronococcus sp. TaxID=35747 RepID=UPI003A4DBB67